MTTSEIDISILRTVDTEVGTVVLRDNMDREKQTTFDKWYMSMECWKTSIGETAKASTKLKNLNWDAAKTSHIWDLFNQGAVLKDGRPIIYCGFCFQVYQHSAIAGTSTAIAHLKRDRHIGKAKKVLYGDTKSTLTVDHQEVVKTLRRSGSVGVLVNSPLTKDLFLYRFG